MNDELGAESGSVPAGSIRIRQSRALSYRAPRKSGPNPTNYVVQLTAETAGEEEVVGYGESHPRWNHTGDDAGSSWNLLNEAVRQLEGRVLSMEDSEQGIQAVRGVMDEMRALADERNLDEDQRRPFRGTLIGIEAALLDVVAQGRGGTLAALLGKQRDAVTYVPEATLKSRDFLDETTPEIALDEGVLSIRFRGPTDREQAPQVFQSLISRTTANSDSHRTVWIDSGSSLSLKQASALARDAISAFSERQPHHTILLAQPFKSADTENFFALQNEVEELSQGHSSVDFRVVADDSVWDSAALEALTAQGKVRAIRVRPARAGGLLAISDLVRSAARAGIYVCLSGMGDESRIGASTEHQLALALDRIDLVETRASVEKMLPLTEAVGEIRNVDTDPLVNQENSSQDAELSENPEEMDFDGDEEGEDEELLESEALATDQDLSVAHLEEEGAPGIGVGISFISLVNDVEKMVTYPAPPLPEFEGMTPNVFDDIDDLHPLGARGSKGHLAEREALALGLSTTRYSKGVFLASDGIKEPINFKWNRHPLVSAVALGLCTHKEATRLQLQRAGIPVPQGRTFERGDIVNARAFAERIGYPVVMKPAMGVRGIGVVANIQNEAELNDAYELMTGTRLGDQDFIVEKHINGKDYRIVVVGNQVVAAILREPASVVGDGVQSVAELLLNRNSARRRNPHLWARPPQYNAAAKYQLDRQGLTINSVPESGRGVSLGSTNSLSQGGESMAVLEDMHPSILEACLKVVRSVPGMDYCGVDFLLEDHTKPLDEQDAGICELNAHAAIGNCQYPMFGRPRPVARIVMHEVAHRFGLKVAPEPAEQVALRVVIRGKVAGVGFHKWLRRRALEAGVDGWVRSLDAKRIEAVLLGPTNATTALVSSLINGPRRARPTSYVAEHIDRPALHGFEIRPDRSGVEQIRIKAGRKFRQIWKMSNGR